MNQLVIQWDFTVRKGCAEISVKIQANGPAAASSFAVDPDGVKFQAHSSHRRSHLP